MIVIRSIAELRAQREAWRKAGDMVGLVPTMGALHAGHLSLVERALAFSTLTLATLFVNPTQFAPGEDFDRYPRDEAGDLAKLEAAGVAAVFAPMTAEVYPPGSLTRVSVPQLGEILEGEFRPGFFTGVATIVAKLLLLTQPEVALFGEKDYQQLLVIRRLVADLNIPVAIEAGRTIRDTDGLALSSRNAYLSPDERRIAPELYRVISRLAADAAAGGDIVARAAAATAELTAVGFSRVDYIAVRDGETLQAWSDRRRRGRVLAAAWLGRTRLIDNVAVPDLAA